MSSTHFILASIMTNPDKVGQYIAEANRMGIAIKPPDINHSQVEISAKGGEIYFGLADVKNAGKGAARKLLELRGQTGPFTSYDHLVNVIEDANVVWEAGCKTGRSPKAICSARSVNAWRDAGAFDSLGYEEDLRLRSAFQKELLGISLVDIYSPLVAKYDDLLARRTPLASALEERTAPLSYTYALVGDVEIRKTRADAHPRYANKEFAMVGLEWREARSRAVCFNAEWEAFKYDLVEGAFCLLQLKNTNKGPQIAKVSRLE